MRCRFCKEYASDRSDLIRYGIRHYACYACYLDRKGVEDLTPDDLRRFPYRLLEERGLFEWVKAMRASS
jgi:hypothetical protein